MCTSEGKSCLLNWSRSCRNRTGTIRLLAMKMALALLCRGNIEEKYRCKHHCWTSSLVNSIGSSSLSLSLPDVFSLAAQPSTDNDQHDVVDRQRLSVLFQQAIVVRTWSLKERKRERDFTTSISNLIRSRNSSVKWPPSVDRVLNRVWRVVLTMWVNVNPSLLPLWKWLTFPRHTIPMWSPQMIFSSGSN